MYQKLESRIYSQQLVRTIPDGDLPAVPGVPGVAVPVAPAGHGQSVPGAVPAGSPVPVISVPPSAAVIPLAARGRGSAVARGAHPPLRARGGAGVPVPAGIVLIVLSVVVNVNSRAANDPSAKLFNHGDC